jgi:hypothetical protein
VAIGVSDLFRKPAKEHHMRWTKRRSSSLENAIEDIFVFCGLSEEDARKSPAWITKEKARPADFPEAEAFLDANDGELIGISKQEDSVLYFPDVKPSDVPGYDVSTVLTTVGDNGNRQIELYRLRQEPLRKARGQKVYSPHVASMYSCWVDVDTGTYTSNKMLVNCAGKEWVVVGAKGQYFHFAQSKTCDGNIVNFGVTDGEGITSTCNMLLGLSFTRDLVWRVVFKGHSGISVSLSTDTAGAMAAFRNRQQNEVTGRRDALRHWVRQHYRSRHVDEGDEPEQVIVRQHLRGRTPFRWCGIDCELVVSPFDMRRNERLRIEREQMAAV